MSTLDTWLKFGHIVGAIVWLGGGTMLSILALRARSSRDPRVIADFARTLSYVGPRVLTPAVMAVLVFGLWMVLENAAWNLGQTWVLLAIALFALAFVIGGVFLSRTAIALERWGREEDDANRPLPDGLLDRWINGYAVVLAILFLTVWDMVFKPGL